MSTRARIQAWRRTLFGRLAVRWAGWAALAAALGFVASFTVLRQASYARDSERVQAEAIYLESMLAGAVNRFGAQLRQVANEPSIQATLLDSRGREQHIAQFMRLSMPADASSLVEQSAAPLMVVLDYRARVLAQSAAAPTTPGMQATAQRVLKTGVAQASFDPKTTQVVLGYPLRFPGTGHVEGVVLGTLTLGPALNSVVQAKGFRSTASLEANGLRNSRTGASSAEVVLPIQLAAPLERAAIDLRLKGGSEQFRTEVQSLLIGHVAGGLGLFALLLVAAFHTARSLAAPIKSLADSVAANPTQGAPLAPSLATDAPDEVRQLACALSNAFTQLESGRAWLTLLERAMDSAHDGITVVDATVPGLPAVYVNRAVERITGYAPSELLGQNMRILHEGEAEQEALATVRRAIATGEPATVVLRNRHKQGHVFMNELSLAPVRDAAGTVTHFVGIQNDVTERLQDQEHQVMSQKMEALGRLTGGLAHDFNNLLGIIIGNLDQSLAVLADADPTKERLQTALAAALRGADVTRSMLAVARRQPLARTSEDVNRRLRDLRPLFQNSLGARITLEERLDAGDTLAVIDPNGFDSVILNLIINARDALPDGGHVCVETSIAQVDDSGLHGLEPGAYVCVSIADNGVGMPPEVAERAFEPFFTTKSTGKGTGFGLSTAYGFAKQLGGSAAIESRLGEGTRVSLYLPLAPSDEEAASRPSVAMAVPMAPRTAVALRVLVADDEPHLRILASEWIGQLGHECMAAKSGDEAKALMVMEPPFDLLLTDIVMPGETDGLALAHWASQRFPKMRILLASGYSERLGQGAMPWPLLEKPYRKGDLLRVLNAVALSEASAATPASTSGN